MWTDFREESCAVSPILGMSEFRLPYLKPIEGLCLGDRATPRAYCVTLQLGVRAWALVPPGKFRR